MDKLNEAWARIALMCGQIANATNDEYRVYWAAKLADEAREAFQAEHDNREDNKATLQAVLDSIGR